MSTLTKVIVIALLGFAVVVPVVGASSGWGLGTQANSKIISQADSYCPKSLQMADGRCQRTHRSYYFGRSTLGGGPHGGK